MRGSGWLGVLLALVVAGCGGNGGGSPSAGPSPSPTPTRTTLVTTASTPQGWGSLSLHCAGGTSTGAQGFLAGPGTPPRGAGSYALVTGPDGDSWELLGQTQYGGTRLADVTELTLAGYVGVTNVSDLGPTIFLTVDVNADGVWDAASDDVLATLPISAGVGVWQAWDGLGGEWCSGTFGTCGTIVAYVSAHPGAELIDAGFGTASIAAGCMAPEYDGYEIAIDMPAIGVGSTITEYDFEP